MRNYEVDSILVRREANKGYRLLLVESIQEERGRHTAVMLRHEDGHREFHSINTAIPIECALFGYRVVTEDDMTRGFLEMDGTKILVD